MKTYRVLIAIFFVAILALLWRSSDLRKELDKAEADKWWCQQNLDLLENNNRDMALLLWRANLTVDSLQSIVDSCQAADIRDSFWTPSDLRKLNGAIMKWDMNDQGLYQNATECF